MTSHPDSPEQVTRETWYVDAWNQRAVAWDDDGNPTAYEEDVGYRHVTEDWDDNTVTTVTTDYIKKATIRS